MTKRKKLQPRILYPARLSFRFDREIQSFIDKQKLREFSTNKLALKQILKELLYVEKKRPQLQQNQENYEWESSSVKANPK